MASTGKSTREYRAIQGHHSNLVNNLGKTVDPAHFARKLRDKSLISEDIVEEASVVGVLTGSQRISPVINAVLAQIKLRANVFHTFMSILKAENSLLADTISGYYTCSLELHALGVLESVSDWQELGRQLNIDPEKLLLLSQCGRDPDYCREQVVLEWLEGDKEASWEKLCIALELMGSEAEVLKIREQYISDDMLAATSSEDVDTQPESAVAEQVNEFEDRFADLTFRLQTEMEEKETPVKKFQQTITLLPLAIRKDHLQFIEDSLDNITNAESIKKLFLYLNLYWTFFDCNLLQHFVRRHGSEELKEELKKYTEDLEVFRRMTTVKQLLKVFPDGFRSEEPPPNFSQVIIKLDQKASECTLEKLEQFRHQFCSKFSLPTFALMLASVEEGSITIIWYVPSSEVHRFHNTAIQWKSISTELLQFQVDGLLFHFATIFNAQALPEYTALTHLYSGSFQTDANGIAFLSSLLRDKSCLQYIDLGSNNLGTDGAKFLVQVLSGNTALNYLDLSHCQIGDDGIALLSSSLGSMSCLKHLDLRVNRFGSKGAECLAQALTENTSLVHLDLGWCDIGADIGTDGVSLLSSLLRNKPCLQYLNLSWSEFGSEGAEDIGQALTENTTLTHLYLIECDIDANGVAFLSLSLRNKLCLRVLDLNGNWFGSEGAEYLAQALTENTTLTHLNLSECDIGVDGMALLSSSLRNKSCLQSLTLSGNKFGSEGAEYLAQALAENTALVHLDLRWCDIDADGIALLSSLLKNKSCLQHDLNLRLEDPEPVGSSMLFSMIDDTSLTGESLQDPEPVGSNIPSSSSRSRFSGIAWW